MRDQMIKLYVDDDEMEMIRKMAESGGLPVNRFLRDVIYWKALASGYTQEQAHLFNRVYTKRHEVY